MSYYLWLNEAQSGPFTISQLKSMWGHGAITSQTLYWQEGETQWKPLIEIVQMIEAQAASHTPVQPPAIPQTYIPQQPQIIYIDKGGSENEATSPSGASWAIGLLVSLLIPFLGLVCGVLVAFSRKDRAMAVPMVLISLISSVVYYFMFFARVS